MKHKFFLLSLGAILIFSQFVLPVKAENDPIVVVIDPGHSGENLGADYQGYVEKNMTMVVANAMYDELTKYEGIEVYLTHTEDVDMTIQKRADFAHEKNADFLFCLHFNMSPNNNLFGTEVWISASPEEYAKAYPFADIQIKQMQDIGLYNRGIKTKLNEDDFDYYGILRYSTEYNMAAALIEHCHLDHKNDEGYYETDEKLKKMGVLDATAVAKYYGLKSSILGTDYSDYAKVDMPVPAGLVRPDTTDPDVCYLEQVSSDYDTGRIELKLTATDYDSPMLYYDYSIDGGVTFTEHFAWFGTDTVPIVIDVPSGVTPVIVARAYNLFDRFLQSEMISYGTFQYGEASKESDSDTQSLEETDSEDAVVADSDSITFKMDRPDEEKEKTVSFLTFLELCLACVVVLFVIVLITKIVSSSHNIKRRKR